jgi:hypothetical protein
MDTGGDQIVTSNGFWFMGGYARYVWPCYLATARLRAARAQLMAAGEES